MRGFTSRMAVMGWEAAIAPNPFRPELVEGQFFVPLGKEHGFDTLNPNGFGRNDVRKVIESGRPNLCVHDLKRFQVKWTPLTPDENAGNK